jgi:hypothetical protein
VIQEGRDGKRRVGMGWEEIVRSRIVERTGRFRIGWKGTRRIGWDGVKLDKKIRFWYGQRKDRIREK